MDWTTIIITLITSGATLLTVIVQTRKNDKKIEETAKETRELAEVNDYKTYLLVLLSLFPQKGDEIFTVARHYFEDLGGDSFIVPLFGEWLEENHLAKPEWYLSARAKHPGGDY